MKSGFSVESRCVNRPASSATQILENKMKKISALVLAASLASTAAFAGGPVMAPTEPAPAVTPAPASSISAGIVIPLLLIVALAAALSN
jgi:hypothetical protein